MLRPLNGGWPTWPLNAGRVMPRPNLSPRKRNASVLPTLALLSVTRSRKDRIMASRKCNASRGLAGRRCAHSDRAAGYPALTPQKRLGGRSGASWRGVGGVAPDGDSNVRSGATFDAGRYLPQITALAARPGKPAAVVHGLCVQPVTGYHLACYGKSFSGIMPGVKYTSYKVKAKQAIPGHVLECRAEQGRKLRSMYRCLGWSRADCAKFLHVTERCLHNWEAGRHSVSYAAYRG